MVRFGRDVGEEELGESVGTLVDDRTSLEDDASGTDTVSVAVQPTVV